MVCGYTTTLPETNGSKRCLEFCPQKETKKKYSLIQIPGGN